MRCAWATLPTCTSRGLCAYQRVNAHVQGVRVQTTLHDRHHCAQNADHLNHNTPFSPFFTEVVCTLGTTQPHVAASPPPNGGIARHEAPTRRRHAASQPLMLQNPHRHRRGGRRRDCRAWPRHPWAAGPGLPQKSHAIRLGEDSTSPKTLRFQRCEFRA